RKLGLIRADVAVALSLSLTHKEVGFDRAIPAVEVDSLDLEPTGTLPVGVPGAARYDGARNRQRAASWRHACNAQARSPTNRAAHRPTMISWGTILHGAAQSALATGIVLVLWPRTRRADIVVPALVAASAVRSRGTPSCTRPTPKSS